MAMGILNAILSIFLGIATLHLSAQPLKPVITGSKAIVIDEDTPFTIALSDLTVADAPNYPAGYSIVIQGGANYSFKGAEITPGPNYVGQVSVHIKVMLTADPTFISDETIVAVTVLPVDDPPTPFHLLKPTNESVVYDFTSFIWGKSYDVEAKGIKYDLKFEHIGGPTWFLDLTDTLIIINMPFFTNMLNRPVTWSVTAKDGTGNKTPAPEVFSLQSIIAGVTETNGTQVYPNPVRDKLTIHLQSNEASHIKVRDMKGTVVLDTWVGGNGVTTIDVSTFRSGAYLIFIDGARSSIHRIFIE